MTDTIDRTRYLHNHGLVQIIDVMGDDQAIVDAARVSYAKGTKTTRNNRGLIRYLFSHKHSSPFEMAELKFVIKAPIFVARQWVRHRTACLSGDTLINFDLPFKVAAGRRRAYPLTVKQIYDRFKPSIALSRPDKQGNEFFKRDRVRGMLLRSCDESDNTPYHTRLVDIWQSGVKPLIRVDFMNGDFLRATKDHLCYTDKGWLRLEDALAQKSKFARFGRSTGYVSEAPVFSEEEIAKERWVPVSRVPGYEISDLGRVRPFRKVCNTPGINTDTPKVKTLTISPSGYPIIGLSENGKTSAFLVHRLVLESFGHSFEENQHTRHLDNNRQNNRLTNLGYGTAKDNNRDRMESGCDQTLTIVFEHPVAAYPDGEEMTYDMSVKGPFHNFSAGNTVVHNSLNEWSGRYSVMENEFYLPTLDYIKKQSETNKQGGGEAFSGAQAEHLTLKMSEISEESFGWYDAFIEDDLARETARIILPLNTYTTWVWKIDLHNLLHFLTLRADPHAQQEIRDYAEAIITLVAPLFPLTFEAWEDYQRQAKSFSRMDLALLQAIMRRFTSPQASLYALVDEHRGVERLGTAYGMTKREIVAFFDKVGVVVPEGG